MVILIILYGLMFVVNDAVIAAYVMGVWAMIATIGWEVMYKRAWEAEEIAAELLEDKL